MTDSSVDLGSADPGEGSSAIWKRQKRSKGSIDAAAPSTSTGGCPRVSPPAAKISRLVPFSASWRMDSTLTPLLWTGS